MFQNFIPFYGCITPLCKYSTFCLSIHLWWTLEVFRLWAIVNKAAVNTAMYSKIPLWAPLFNYFGYKLRSRSGRPYGISVFSFLRNHQNVSKWLHHLHSYQLYTRVPVASLFVFHPNGYDMVFCVSFDLHFLNDLIILNVSFSCVNWSFVYFIGSNV